MKVLLVSILCLASTSVFSQDFERGYNAGLKTCSEYNFYICSSDLPNSRLKIRSTNRGQAIKRLYDYCMGPSGSSYYRECVRIVEQDQISCKTI